jgi:broad specificity phosphatase PhoE
MSARLTLICHAATRATHTAAFPLDEPAELVSLAKVSRLAVTPDRVLTSPALRARQTAEALGLDAEIDEALRDIDLGSWAGRTLGDIQAAEPEVVALWIADPEAAPHGGESVAGLLRRVAPWLEAQRASRVVAVTHASVIRAAIVLAIDAGAAAFWRIDVAPLCRVELRGDGRRWTLRSIGG